LALDPEPGDRVLDMCCAPGAKLCLIADLMGAAGALVGVDASVARLSTCASLLRKYALVSAGHLQRAWRLQLYGCDARLFNAAPPAVPLFTGAGGGAIAGMPPLSAVDFVRTRLAARCGGGGGRADGGDGGGGGGSSDGSTGWLEGDSSCGGSELPPPSFTCSDGSEGEGGGSGGSGGDGGGVTAATTAAPVAAPVAVFAIAGSADAGGSGGGRGRASPAAAAPPARKAPRHVRHARGAAGHERLPLSYDAPLFDSLHENLFRRVREAPARGLHPVTTPRLLQVCRDVLDADAAAAAHSHPPPPLPLLYDRVLVDAECSHDGSVKHVAKQLGGSRGGAALVEHMTADGKAASLRDLQRGLLANGFRVLRPGGVLVYSTCSLTVAQNEDVVAWLLATDPRASLLPLPTPPPPPPPLVPAAEGGAVDADALRAAFAALHASPSPPALPGAMPGTLRFEPLLSGCSGLFIARITKRDDSGPAPLPPPSSS